MSSSTELAASAKVRNLSKKGAVVYEEITPLGFARTCDKLSHPPPVRAGIASTRARGAAIGIPRLLRLMAASRVLGATICRIDKAVHAI